MTDDDLTWAECLTLTAIRRHPGRWAPVATPIEAARLADRGLIVYAAWASRARLTDEGRAMFEVAS